MTNAVRFSAANQRYNRSASGLNISTSITWCCWVKMVVNRGTYSMAMASDNGGSNAIQFGTTSSGTAMVVFANSGGHNPGYSFVVGTWTFIAVTQNLAGNDYSYYAAAPATTTTEVLGGQMTGFFDANTFYIGSDGFGDWWNGSIAAVKVWTAALTKTELEAEMAQYAPVRTANIWAAYKFDAGPQTTDDSGNGRTLTAGAGTATLDSSGPPISTGGATSYDLTATGTGTSTGTLAVAALAAVSATGTGTTTGSLDVIRSPLPLTGSGVATTVGTLAVSATRIVSATGAATSTGTLAVTITSGPALLTLVATGYGTTTGHLAVTGTGTPSGGGALIRGASPGGYQPRNTPAERRAFFDHKRQLAQLEARIKALEP